MNSRRLFGVVVVGLITVSLLGLMVYFDSSRHETDNVIRVDSKEGSEEVNGSDDVVRVDEANGLDDVVRADEAAEPDGAGDVEDVQKQRNIEGRYRVLNVYDGDTFTVDYNGVETSVRIIGINTPETVDPRKTVECFGEQASSYLKNKLYGREVDLERDYTQDNRDKYDRLLRYAYLDGEDIGYDVIYNGYGYEYTYYIPYEKQSEYKEAEKDAEQSGRGLWEEGVCE